MPNMPEQTVSRELESLVLSAAGLEDFLSALTGLAATTFSERTGSSVDCGVAVENRNGSITVGGSNARALHLAHTGQRVGEGPCLEVMRTKTAVLAEDVLADPRWLSYGQNLVSGQCRSVMVIPLEITKDATAALSFFADGQAFNAETVKDAESFARTAVRAFRLVLKIDAARRTAEGLREALENQTALSIACGIIMGQNRCSRSEAWAVLAGAAEQSDTSMRDLAEEIVTNLSGNAAATFFQA